MKLLITALVTVMLSTAAHANDAQTSLAASFLNFETHCSSDFEHMTDREAFTLANFVIQHQHDVDDAMLKQDLERGYAKYDALWCANTASIARHLAD